MAVADIASPSSIVQQLVENDAFYRLINDPLAQFGPAKDPYVFAQWLPERQVPENSYTEEGIRYRSPIANHGTRYSPVQIKEGMISGTMKVELGNSDIGAEFTGQQYDTFIKLLRRVYGRPGIQGGGVTPPTIQAMAQMLNWVDLALVRPLHARNELDRVNAVVNAQVVMLGDDNYTETVTYPNVSGQRVTAAGTWSSNTYDPWGDIMAMYTYLKTKGFTVGAIIIGVDVLNILANNLIMRTRTGFLAINTNIVSGVPGRLSIDDLNAAGSREGLPPFQLYDKQYYTQTGSAYYYPRATMTMICLTGRDQEIDRGDAEPLVVHDTLGYVGIGTPAGQPDPGMVVLVEPKDGKPPHIRGQAWQTSLPVLTDPEGIGVISGIA